MTSKSVTGLNNVMNNFVQNTAGNFMNTSQVSFSSVMQQTTGNGSNMQDLSAQNGDRQTTEIQKPVQAEKNSKVVDKLEKDVENSMKPVESQTLEEAEEALEKAAEKVVEEIADALGLSKEEVETAMETLGLAATDLLQADNVTMLMMNLSGESDMLALTTDEVLYADINKVLGSLESNLNAVQETFDISDAQMEGLMTKLMETPAEPVTDATADVLQTETVLEEISQDDIPKDDKFVPETQVKEVLEAPMEKVITITKNGEEVQAVVETDGESGVETITQQSAPATDQSEEGMTQQEENHAGQESGGKENSQNSGVVLQNTLQNQNLNTTLQTAETPFSEAQVQDIMDQILESVKIQIKPDTSSLEMQLHPESLGTLNIHISSKDGILTAQFTTQNEAIKNVIEGQVATLQQNLNEQGIKVEAVEVNVEARPFDRSLDQGQDGQNSHQSEEAKKKSARKIQLRGLDSLEEGELEEMEEADKLTADMMMRNGNTVDYLA